MTEAFAGVLESSLPLRVAFVQWLVELDAESVQVETQMVVETGDKPDLWLLVREHSGSRHVVLFENKLWSGQGRDQLLRYKRYLQEHHREADSRTLIYLTLHAQNDVEPFENASSSSVVFRELHWFQIFDWMNIWAQSVEAQGCDAVLANELLALMEEWNLTTNLNARDLAAAVAHRTSVEHRMLLILDEVWKACQFRGTKDKKWSYERRLLNYKSPWIGDDENQYFEFGFDFYREDQQWNVHHLQLPSAYFAIIGELGGKRLPRGWGAPPDDWEWKDGPARMKRLNALEAQGESLHKAYLEFFKKALKEAEKAVGLE